MTLEDLSVAVDDHWIYELVEHDDDIRKWMKVNNVDMEKLEK